MSVRPANQGDLPTIATIHKACFRTHFLGQYSTSLLAAFYGSFLGQAVLLVHESASGVDGFVLGGEVRLLTARRAAFLRSHLLQCLWETLLRPHVWWASVRRTAAMLGVRSDRSAETAEARGGGTFSLLSIAVAEVGVGKGVASALVLAFESAVLPMTPWYRLTVNRDNARAIGFYHKMGFTLARDSGRCLEFRKTIHL